MHNFTFLREVLLANRSTGAIGPSSRKLAEAITELAELSGNKVLVEYGPGTGVFTEVILQRKDPDAILLALEVNERFVESTQRRCPEANVVHDGAQNAVNHLREMGHEQCDLIISGLPWTRFGEALQDEILNATYEVLRPGGRFLTFGYSFSPLLPAGKRFFKGKLNDKFDHVRRSKTIWKNLPPCSVYIADKKAE